MNDDKAESPVTFTEVPWFRPEPYKENAERMEVIRNTIRSLVTDCSDEEKMYLLFDLFASAIITFQEHEASDLKTEDAIIKAALCVTRNHAWNRGASYHEAVD